MRTVFPLASAHISAITTDSRAMAQSGSASVWGTEGREFESR